MKGLRFRFRVYGVGFTGFMFYGLGFRVHILGFRV